MTHSYWGEQQPTNSAQPSRCQDLESFTMSQSYDSEYVRLLRGERDRVRAILAKIYERAKSSCGCDACARIAHDTLEALTPPASWDDYYAA